VPVKKAIGIVFLSLLLLQIAGTYVYFIVRLSGIRAEMREKLKLKPDEELTRLDLTLLEYKKAKVDDHEVKVGGKMYDIARIQIQGNRVLIYGLQDEAEDDLLSFLQEMVKRTSKDKKPVPTSLINLMSLVFVVIDHGISARAELLTDHLTPYCFFSLPISQDIETPPPRA